MLPRHLQNFTAFVDGVGQAGSVQELTLPVLTLKTDEHRAGGMDAPVDIDLGMEKLELSMVVSSYSRDQFKAYGALGVGVPLTVRGAIQRQGEGAQAVVIKMLGTAKVVDRGTWSAGEKQTTTITYTLTKYQELIAGQRVVNIDIENMIREIDGVDQLASQRRALGI